MEINLPIYKSLYSLSLDIFLLVKTFNREHKYTSGEKLKFYVIKMLECVAMTIHGENKLKQIKKCRKILEKMRILIRILKDLKEININKFIIIEKNKLEEIVSVVNSYMGLFSKFNTYKLRCKILNSIKSDFSIKNNDREFFLTRKNNFLKIKNKII